jgi:hypothetical protein
VEVIVTIEAKDFVRNADLEELLKCGNQVGELDIEPLTNRRAFMLRKSYNFLAILLLKTN